MVQTILRAHTRIWVVDNLQARLTALALQKRGYDHVKYFAEPNSVRHEIISHRAKPEVVLMDRDLGHPTIDGDDLAQMIKRYSKHSKIICISGYDSMALNMSSATKPIRRLPDYYDGQHVKPIDLNRLEETMLAVLRLKY